MGRGGTYSGVQGSTKMDEIEKKWRCKGKFHRKVEDKDANRSYAKTSENGSLHLGQ